MVAYGAFLYCRRKLDIFCEAVLEMEGGIREQGTEGEPREDKSGSEWDRR